MADESDMSGAEKAYADAAAKVDSTPKVADKTPEPIDAPKAEVAAKPAPAAKPVAKKAPARPAAKKPAAPKSAAKKPTAKAAPKPKAVTARKAPAKPKTSAKPKTVAKAKSTAKPKPPVESKAPAKIAAKIPAPESKEPTLNELKERIMATAKTKTPDFSGMISDVKDKAKAAYAKGSEVVGEVGTFTKGNVEAFVESGKILASGVKDMGTEYVAETKSAFDTVTADMKKLAAVKSPTEFFQLQGEIARRNFDSAVAMSSKSTEKFVKLSNDTFAPISNRISLAAEKISKAA